MEVVDEFIFTQEAERFSSSVTTMTLYQVLLGRDPENSYVIEENKTQPIGALFRSFVRSAEFADFVLSPLQRQARLRHELTSPAPSVQQREWLPSLLVMPPAQRGAIVAATSWREFFCAMLGLAADDAVDEAPPRISVRTEVPAATPVSLPEVVASEPTLMSAVLEEITAIELRLDRLKGLVQKLGDGVLH